MKTLAKLVIVAVTAVSSQAMAGSDPFAAMEPAGPSQHGNMSQDKMKRFSWGDKDEPEADAVEASLPGVESKAERSEVAQQPKVEVQPDEKVVETRETAKVKAVAVEPTVQPEKQVREVASEPKVETKPQVDQVETVTEPENKSEKTVGKESEEKSSLEEGVIEFASKAEKFLDEISFSKGVDESLFQDGDTLK